MTAPDRWLRKDGTVVSCTESVKVLTETWEETETALQDFFEDAVLLGVAKAEWKASSSTRSSVTTRKRRRPPKRSLRKGSVDGAAERVENREDQRRISCNKCENCSVLP